MTTPAPVAKAVEEADGILITGRQPTAASASLADEISDHHAVHGVVQLLKMLPIKSGTENATSCPRRCLWSSIGASANRSPAFSFRGRAGAAVQQLRRRGRSPPRRCLSAKETREKTERLLHCSALCSRCPEKGSCIPLANRKTLHKKLGVSDIRSPAGSTAAGDQPENAREKILKAADESAGHPCRGRWRSRHAGLEFGGHHRPSRLVSEYYAPGARRTIFAAKGYSLIMKLTTRPRSARRDQLRAASTPRLLVVMIPRKKHVRSGSSAPCTESGLPIMLDHVEILIPCWNLIASISNLNTAASSWACSTAKSAGYQRFARASATASPQPSPCSNRP